VFRTLLAKELLETVKTVKFLVTFVAYLVFIPLALYTGQTQYEASYASYQQALTAFERSLTGSVGALDVTVPALYRPSALVILSRNMIPYFPSGFTISAEHGMQISTASLPPSLFEKIFGSFDLLFVVTVVISLLSVLLVYDSVSGEKEQGTLRLLLSYSIPRWKLVIAKFLGPFFASSKCIAVGYLVGLLVLLVTTDFALGSEMLVSVPIVMALTLAYCATSLLLGLAASVFTYRSTNSLLSAILLWMLLVLVVPRVGMLTAAALVPVPPPEQMSLQEALLRRDIQAQQNRELERIFDAPNYQESRKPIVERYEQKLAAALKEQEDTQFRQRDRQESLALLLSGLSPTTQLTRALTELSDSGYSALNQWIRDVRLYYATIAKSVYSRGFRDEIPNQGVKMMYEPVNLSDLPRFTQSTRSMGERIRSIAFPFTLLLVFDLLLFIVVFARGLTYDPR
jgi:ABC-type transport system involved in multi-copper enzyme maturation permease subunit